MKYWSSSESALYYVLSMTLLWEHSNQITLDSGIDVGPTFFKFRIFFQTLQIFSSLIVFVLQHKIAYLVSYDFFHHGNSTKIKFFITQGATFMAG